ncbi:trypsin-like peptidase domain-containing protein [Kitasatospora sp. NPDC015120]|uniref:nSTAND1 domain-containing NTPase n=1 Tax=Kitasatospora sp. NPDC015120 TaxID=3364023 RepID=UPI0036F4AC40
MAVGRGMAGAGAADGLAAAVAQVRDEDDLVVGAGFLVADDLLVTCAHVLEDGRYGPDSTVTLAFPRALGAPVVTGRVLEGSWRDPQEQDVALVRLDRPAGVEPLRLGSAAGARGHRVRSFGFPQQAPPGGHYGFATAGGILPAADEVGELLQLTGANDLTQGFSGGPVLDETTSLVVGMLTAITTPDGHHRGQEIAYVTPTSVLREAWSELDEANKPHELDVSPYRALEPFTAEHARWFRGREDAVNRVLEGLRGGRRVVLLLGPSGSGKSSLVQAGVLPALTAGRLPGSDRWHQVLTRPGPGLPAALTRAGLPGSEPGDTGADTAGSTDSGRGAAGAPPVSRVVLVVDQFEELLAPSEGPEALQTLARITAAIRSDAPLSVVLVMRDDFYSRLSAVAPDLLDTALQAKGVLNVPATLSATDLDAIVTGPARDLDTPFEPGLAEQIIAHVLELNPGTAATGGAPVTVLPLLEVALTRLWERRLDYDGRLTRDAYHRIGAVTGALTEWCGTALGKLDQAQRNIARRILTALVRPADPSLNIPAARQQLPISELRELAADSDTPDALRAVDEVLAVLSRNRIVTTHRLHDHAQPQDTEGTAVAELVHDALIRDWNTLRQWVEEDARFLDWLRRARDQYDRWKEHRNPQDLPTGTLLAEGTDWSRQRRRITTDLDNFLKAGRRRGRRLNTILATTLALALIASGIAFWQQQKAVAAQKDALSRQLAAQSVSLIASDFELASLLAVAAYRTSPTAEAGAALRDAAHLPVRRRFAAGISDSGGAVAFIRDQHTLATVGNDGSVRLWDTTTGKITAPDLAATNDDLLHAVSVASSRDGHTLAVVHADGSVRLWDTDTGKTTAPATDYPGGVTSVAFGPDKHTLAIVGHDGSVRLWDTDTGKTTAPAPDLIDLRFTYLHNPATGKITRLDPNRLGGMTSVAFNSDGSTLAIASSAGPVRLWDTTTGKITTAPVLPDDTGAVTSVAFSPDGGTLVTGSDNGIVRHWNVAAGTAISTPSTVAILTGGTRGVFSAAFSPDGRTFVTGSADGSVRLWDEAAIRTVSTVGTPVEFPGFSRFLRPSSPERPSSPSDTRDVTSVAFSPDGRTLATGTRGGLVRLWDITTGKTTTAPDINVALEVESMAFGPDGHTLAILRSDGTVQLRNTTTGIATAPDIATTDDEVWEAQPIAFGPDGHTIAVGVGHDTVRLWDINTGRTIGPGITTTASDESLSVTSVAFSPDRHTLAVASHDGSVRLRDITTGRTTATNFISGATSMAFGPDRHTLAVASNEGSIRLWDTTTGKTTTALADRQASGLGAFSPDGHTFAATAYVDGDVAMAVRLWFYIAPDAAISGICTAVARDLTNSEKYAYLPESSGPVCPS